MDKKGKEQRNRADLTIQASREAELLFVMTKHNELKNLAYSGNTFAKHELAIIRTGLSANLEALLPIDCSHAFETPFGHQIKLRLCTKPFVADGFEIREYLCPICGKTVEIAVRKAKELRRGC